MILRWILHLLGVDDGPDPAWDATFAKHGGVKRQRRGPRVPRATVEADAAAVTQHAERIDESRRKLAAQRAQPRTPATVATFPREAAK